jgi:DNA repair protein RadC
LVKETSKLTDLLLQKQQELADLRKQEEHQHIEIHGLESAKSQVLSHIQQIEKEILRQQDIVYNKVSIGLPSDLLHQFPNQNFVYISHSSHVFQIIKYLIM